MKGFNFERLPIKEILLRFCNGNNLNENNEIDLISKYVNVITKANDFATIKELHEVRLINDKHLNHYLSFKNFKKDDLELLRTKSLKTIPLFKAGG